jgi:hypothetical protein
LGVGQVGVVVGVGVVEWESLVRVEVDGVVGQVVVVVEVEVVVVAAAVVVHLRSWRIVLVRGERLLNEERNGLMESGVGEVVVV